MIRVTVEMIPGGDENHSRRRVIGTATIANVGGTATVGNYRYELRGKRGRRIRAGAVCGFPRKRMHVWDLLYLALKDARGARNRGMMPGEVGDGRVGRGAGVAKGRGKAVHA